MKKIKTVALFANDAKPQAAETLSFVSSYLMQAGVKVTIESSESFLIDNQSLHKKLEQSDLIISIGGDGSILHLVHRLGIPSSPLAGINLGSLGFLAEIPLQGLEEHLDELLSGNISVSERSVLEGSSSTVQGFAINEVSIYRGNIPHLIDIAIYVDDEMINIFSADGVIIATPGGSTAYSLSAGGPIVTPDLSALVLTPICPHTISNRPIVLAPKKALRVELLNDQISVDVAFDGQKPLPLTKESPLTLFFSEKKFKLISLKSNNFFKTLRSKLGWTGSLKKQSW
jgi:NAD+ kinase